MPTNGKAKKAIHMVTHQVKEVVSGSLNSVPAAQTVFIMVQ